MPSKPSRNLVTISGSASLRFGRLSMPRFRFSGGFDHVLGEFLHRVEPGFLDLAFGTGAQIGHFGFRTQPFILGFLQFGFQRLDAAGGFLHQGFRGGFRRGLNGRWLWGGSGLFGHGVELGQVTPETR